MPGRNCCHSVNDKLRRTSRHPTPCHSLNPRSHSLTAPFTPTVPSRAARAGRWRQFGSKKRAGCERLSASATHDLGIRPGLLVKRRELADSRSARAVITRNASGYWPSFLFLLRPTYGLAPSGVRFHPTASIPLTSRFWLRPQLSVMFVRWRTRPIRQHMKDGKQIGKHRTTQGLGMRRSATHQASLGGSSQATQPPGRF